MGLHLTVGESLLGSVRKYADKTAIVFEDKRFTFREVNDRVNRAAHALLALGLAKGDRVAILSTNNNEIVEIVLALAKCGMVAVPVNFRFVASEVEYVVNLPGCKALFVLEDFVGLVQGIRTKLPKVEHYVSIAPKPIAGMLDYETLLAATHAAEPGIVVDDHDPWFIGFTSGTTGFPKGAVLTHASRIMPALYIAIEYGLRDTDVGMVTMPILHSNGLTFAHLALMMGNTVVIVRQFDPEDILRTIATHTVTYTSMVPTMYTRILTLPKETKARFNVGSMRVLCSSSAPLMTQTKEQILAFFSSAELNEFYGSTEAGIVTNLKPRDQMRKLRSVGPAVFGVQVKVLDETGNEVRPGEVGELFSLGPCFVEYYGNPDATRRAFCDGWFTAGDMARVDDEGYIYIVDRRTDLILSGGENIYPAEIEDVLVRHPGVRELAIIGVPHPLWGEAVHAVIVANDAAVITCEDIERFCTGRIASYKRPRSIELVQALPKTATGKVLRRLLKDERSKREEATS